MDTATFHLGINILLDLEEQTRAVRGRKEAKEPKRALKDVVCS